MQRRSLLKLGAASAVVLAIAGTTAALIRPGLVGGKLSAPARMVFSAVGPVMLQGAMDAKSGDRRQLDDWLVRVEQLIAGLPPATQDELSQLLSILASKPGRLGLAGLSTDWSAASQEEIAHALQAMRFSGVSLRQQAYQALHDICGGAWFSDAGTWTLLGYPGPLDI